MKKIFITSLILFFPLTSFANQNEVIFNSETKTIRELKGDLVDIKKEEKLVEGKIKTFINKTNLGTYIKQNLSSIELSNLELIVQEYIDTENQLKQKEKKAPAIKDELLKLKVRLYKDLAQFVQPSKYDLYLEYIERDTKYIKKQTTIKQKKINTQAAMDSRVKILEKKIEKHNSAFNKEIKALIENKVEEKIISIFSSEKFKKLEYKKQLEIVGTTLKSIRINLAKAQKDSRRNTNIALQGAIIQKIDVYNIAIQKIQSFREKLIKTRK